MNKTTIIRIAEFRQFKEVVRGSNEYLIVGIDVSKDKHHAFFGTANGKSLLRRFIFDNNRDGFTKFLEQADTVKKQYGLSKIVFGLEPTSNYHKPLGHHLIRLEREVVMVSGVAVKRNRELLNGRWDKHDTKCAANVADLISQGKCLFFEDPSTEISGLRNLLSLRERMKKQYHSLKMRIRGNLLAKFFPEFDRHFGKSPDEGLSIVKYCLDPGRITDIGFDEFFHTVTTRDRGIAQKNRLRMIHKLASESIGCPMTRDVEFEANILVDQVRLTKQIIERIDQQIEYSASQFTRYHLLKTIPGFGPYISALVMAKIGDPLRFENRGQVLKMAGMDLSAKRSGKSSSYAKAVISKKGSNQLRYALYQAALVASSRNRLFIKYFTNKLKGREKEHGIRIKMRVKLAAKMLVIAWTLIKKHLEFNPDYLLVDE